MCSVADTCGLRLRLAIFSIAHLSLALCVVVSSGACFSSIVVAVTAGGRVPGIGRTVNGLRFDATSAVNLYFRFYKFWYM